MEKHKNTRFSHWRAAHIAQAPQGDGPFVHEPRMPEQNRAFAIAFLVNRWEQKANEKRRSYEQLLKDIERAIRQASGEGARRRQLGPCETP